MDGVGPAETLRELCDHDGAFWRWLADAPPWEAGLSLEPDPEVFHGAVGVERVHFVVDGAGLGYERAEADGGGCEGEPSGDGG